MTLCSISWCYPYAWVPSADCPQSAEFLKCFLRFLWLIKFTNNVQPVHHYRWTLIQDEVISCPTPRLTRSIKVSGIVIEKWCWRNISHHSVRSEKFWTNTRRLHKVLRFRQFVAILNILLRLGHNVTVRQLECHNCITGVNSFAEKFSSLLFFSSFDFF